MFSVVMHYYNNRSAIANQLERLRRFAPDAFDLFRLILVDDCSSEPVEQALWDELADPPLDRLNIRLFRILDSGAWNQTGARNLGCFVAPDSWLFCTDVDHFVPEDAIRKLAERVDAGPDPETLYRVTRTRLDTGELINPHVNSFLINRASLIEIGGYDEDFAGGYGHSDKMFLHYWKEAGRGASHFDDIQVIVDAEAMTADLDRDPSRNKALYKKKSAGELPPNERRLNFSWRLVFRRGPIA